MDPGVLTGFMVPIRPKEIVSPSTKSDELFLSWLSDRKTKDFIVQLASQVDGEVFIPQHTTTKKHTATPSKKGDRSSLNLTPLIAAPLYSLSSNRAPLSLLRRAPQVLDTQALAASGEASDTNTILLSPRSAGDSISRSNSSKKSPRPKEGGKDSPVESPDEESALQKEEKGGALVPQLSLGNISAPTLTQVPKVAFDDLKSLFAYYHTLPPLQGLDELVDELLKFFGLARSLFFPLKHRILLSSTPMGAVQHQHLTLKDFLEKVWTSELQNSDTTGRSFQLIKEDPKRGYLVPNDWIILILGLLEEHPGLSLIKGEVEYQERYIDAVVARIHFSAARRNRTKITLREFRNAQIVASIEQLDQLVDLTRYPRYFDYMSYFVIYSKFTALDRDKDWMITKEELASYSSHAITTRVIERAFQLSRFLPRVPHSAMRRNSHQERSSMMLPNSAGDSSGVSPTPSAGGASSSHSRSASNTGGISSTSGGRTSSKDRVKVSPRGTRAPEPTSASGVPFAFVPLNRFSFMDFAWFILAEEDKSSPASIDLWFSCIDRDEDGYWSPQDIHSFYEEQLFRMEFSALDIVPFEDALVQIIDMVKPEDPSRITLAEIRNSGFATDVFDLIFNLHKFLSHDRALSLDGSVGMEPVPLASWESFASTEYLIALGETPYGDESDEWDDENLDIWVEVATEPADSEAASSSMTSSAGVITPRDVQV